MDCPAPGMDPDHIFFFGSLCHPLLSLRRYSLLCVRQPPRMGSATHAGACSDREICVTRTRPAVQLGATQVAYCVSSAAELELLEAASNDDARRVISRIMDSASSIYNFELVLTGQNDNHAFFNAHTISLVPRDVDNNTIAQPVSCNDCRSLRFLNSPGNTNNFDMNITLPNMHDIAHLQAYVW